MNQLAERSVGELTENFDNLRVPVRASDRKIQKKVYRYYGAQGVIDYVEDYIFDGEYLLVAEDGENLKSQKAPVCLFTTGKFWVNNHAHILQGSGANDTQYLTYLLNQVDFRRFTSGSAQPKLTKENLAGIKLRVHPPDTQRQIANVLSTIDAKIDLNNRINQELERLAKLIYDYWFVQFDFPISASQAAAMGNPSLEGKPYRQSGGKMVYNETLKREIPQGWSSTTLSKFANITMGQSPPGASYNQDGKGTVFFQGSTDFGWRYPKVREYTTSPSRLAKKGDILLSVRAPVGTLNISDQDCCIGRGLAALSAKNGHDSFLYEVMLYFRMIFDRRNASGTTFGSITKEDLHSLEFSRPPEGSELLDHFEEKARPLRQAMLVNHQQNQHLTQLRDWLLPMLMNGQVTVA